MNNNEVNGTYSFHEMECIERLSHYLPSQLPLKDFVHHNPLHCFEDKSFFNAIFSASKLFGYKVSLSTKEFRELYHNHKIREDILESVIEKTVGKEHADEWIHNLFHKEYNDSHPQRIGVLRAKWKKKLNIDIDSEVHTKLFKIISSYLDQGISIWPFPLTNEGFLASLRDLEKNSLLHLFTSKRVENLFLNSSTTLKELLTIIVGDEELFERYLFDQQFAHPGWSGMVSAIEKNETSLLDKRKIYLYEFIFLELLLEIDALDRHYNKKWEPLNNMISASLPPLIHSFEHKFSDEEKVITIWQNAFEWSYYDQVLAGIKKMKGKYTEKKHISFQALFCIDDREGSIRRHIETFDKFSETFATPGHFGLDFYFQPKNGKNITKVCPGGVEAKYLIKEIADNSKNERDIHFSKKTHHPIFGYFLTLTLGFYSAFRLLINIFYPKASPGASSSFAHMGKNSLLTIENKNKQSKQNDLQIGYTILEMADRVEGVLKSIGLIHNFGKLVYLFGHGSSSINNTHYAGYDCGACSGRPGSVNARVFAFMANNEKVRELLTQRNILIPKDTQFIGALHDTSRDEFAFFDDHLLTPENKDLHKNNLLVFENALDMNAKERSRRFDLLNSKNSAKKVHQNVINRSVSLFEPRPELNHATNALCIVGRRNLNISLFLDRRAFMNSYDYSIDNDGEYLSNILDAATPVCAGINLEYYFSRVDNQKFGAGSKLPHNVVGLIGVANGIEGDLRPGLPLQMIELHDPLRLMMIVEHFPDIVLKAIKRNPNTYNWYANDWMKLVAIHPLTYEIYIFNNNAFEVYEPQKKLLDTIHDVHSIFEMENKNLPVYLIKK